MKVRFKRYFSDKNDKGVFLLSFFGGVFAIIIIRIIGDNFLPQSRGIGAFDVLAILVAVGIITGYVSYIMATKNRSGMSVDRASDNAYYLGLLFTLVSLAYSLIKLSSRIIFLDSAGTSGYVLTLLPDFGLALFSTIFGILGRVLLQQMRNEPREIEIEAREELGNAIRQLRYTIGQVVSNLNGLSEQTRLSLNELSETVSDTLKQSADQSTKAVDSVASDIAELSSKIQGQVTDITKFTDDNAKRFNEILESIRNQFEGLSRISSIVKDAERFNETLSAIKDQVGTLSVTSEKIRDYGKKIETSVRSVDDANNEYVEELNKATETLRSKTDRA